MGTGTGSIDLSTLNNLHTNLTQHFWFNSDAGATYGTGVHMTLSSQAEFIANPTGQNILMNTDGISIRSGLIPLMVLDNDSLDFNVVVDQAQGTYRNVASFGVSARIGAQDGYQTVITEGSSSIVSPENVELFSIRPSGNPSSETVWFREYPEGENVTSITLTHTPIPESKIDVYFRKSGGGQMLRIFTAGHSGTAAVYNSEISYDGENTITINNAEGDTYRIEYVMYNYLSPSIDLGALTIGTRKAETNIGNGSATIGRELTAEYPYQVVVGVGNRNFADSLFEVGNGNVTTKKTAFRVKNNGSICEGSGYTTASGDYSHAEGYSTSASGNYSHSEGYYTEATGFYSHAEGFYTDATNNYSHAEGHYTESSNYASHAEGYYTKASGLYSHSEGYYTIAASNHSHAEGSHTIASSDYQHVEGKYNIKDANSKYAHIIGNGTSDSDRSNALTVDWNGTIRTHKNSMKTLLSTAAYMNGDQDLTFSEPVSEQLTGIVLVWSFWSTKVEDYGWRTFFVPKAMIQLHNGVGYDCPLSRPKSSYFGHKYVYIYDTHIKGHADNVATGTANNVPYQNNKWVLRYVFGC